MNTWASGGGGGGGGIRGQIGGGGEGGGKFSAKSVRELKENKT